LNKRPSVVKLEIIAKAATPNAFPSGDLMKFKHPALPSLLLAFLFLTLASCGGGGGGDTSSNPVGQPSLSVQIRDISNWDVYQGKDNTNTTVLASKSFSQQVLMALNGIVSAISGKVAVALDLGGITTYSSNGMIGEVLRFLYLDDTLLITGDLESGYSAIKIVNLEAPKGKILNYRGSEANNARRGTSGFQGVVKRDLDGLIYAWYGNDIIRVDTSTVVYSDAPHFQGSIFSVYAHDRMVFDDQGSLWIGTLNLLEDGTPNNDMLSCNGLYRINSDFSSKTQVLDDTVAVWNLFKDSQSVIWASTNKGAYRIASGGNPVNVYDESFQNKYSGQIIEHAGSIYSIVRNYFHNPNDLGINLIFEFFKWNGTTFIKVCDVYSGWPFDNSAFIWQGNLYITRQGTGTLRFNGVDGFDLITIGDIGIEGKFAKAAGEVIASVHNISGLSVYNLQNNGQTLKLTATNTAEGLIRNVLHTLFLDSDGKLFIGPEASGFNTLLNENFENFEIQNEIVIAGFFKYNDKIFASTAVNTYYIENGQLNLFAPFYTNGARIYNDTDHLWAIVDTGAGNGNVSLLDLITKEKLENIQFDQQYHFYDVCAVPGENAVFIGVGKNLPPNYLGEALSYVIKYNYASRTYEKVNLPDASCKGIFKFGRDGDTLYGVSNNKLFKYENGTWTFYCATQILNSVTAVKKLAKYLFITAGNDSTAGLETVNLDSKTSEFNNSDTIALPSNMVNDLAIESLGSNQFKLWFATRNGLASCNIELPVP
jgi:hypothetical protein